ncbi:MAG: hypothetical protein WBJ37_09045, partial [Bacteroidales bacterium]
MIKPPVLLIIAVIIAFNAFNVNNIAGQEKEKPVTLKGYVTTLQNAMFDSLSGPVSYNNILHNRLNFRGYINNNIILGIELRNRLFTGDLARTGDFYSDITSRDNGWFDMSWNVIKENSFFLNTTVNRLWFALKLGKLEITTGRQRINWGQAIVWNPNDIFNAYSFFDFDYVERPGSDALRFQYFTSSSSVIELAVKTDSEDRVTAAGLIRFNRWGYDIQFLGGYSNSSDIVAGAGWSGTLLNTSFRGEISWFYPVNKGEKSTLLATAGIDKIFHDNSVLQIELMYSGNPVALNDINILYSGTLSAKDLAFSKFTAFGSFTWAFTPLLNTGISAMLFPDLKGYFAGPSLDYSMSENIDLSVIWQHFN